MSAPPRNMDLWVLAGQSNMVGRAPLDGSLPVQPNVWSFTSAGRWAPAQEPLHRLWESFTPVHQRMMRTGLSTDLQHFNDEHWAAIEQQQRKGAGLGIAFGASMTEAHGRPIGLIPCAHGGVSLAAWSSKSDAVDLNTLYDAMLERIRRAQALGTLKGLLWYQGETDATCYNSAQSYADRFDRWIATVRRDIGINHLPIVVVQLGRIRDSLARYPGIDLVRSGLGDVASRVGHTAVTSAIDLGLYDDCHIDTAGLIRLGRRLARCALRLTEQPESLSGPFVSAVELVEDESSRYAVDLKIKGVTQPLVPRENLTGFAVREGGGSTADELCVCSAKVMHDRSDSDIACIRLSLSRAPVAAVEVSYGAGPNPDCRVVDAADMPLCTFSLPVKNRVQPK